MKTFALAVAIVGVLTFAAWRVRAHVDRSRAEEAARRQPPTVDAPALSGTSIAWRWCE